MEETLFKSEERLSREEISQKVRTIADKLSEGRITLRSGNESVELAPSEKPELEIKVEKEGEEISLELEIEWGEAEEEKTVEIE